ncbi:MAG: phosphoglucosamine mutase [candidate division Zixibacteria bacterium]|nr:phosphoglucosamine mutase [candidate division Zixibacteria bacterium]
MKEKQLVKSTSGIRGVIGKGLDPVMVTAYGAAFGTFLKKSPVIVGSDTRPSKDMIRQAVIAGLTAVGIDVIEIGVVPTPTVEIAVKQLKATGGICITASHNPAPWNALKFFNHHGEFITPAQYKKLEKIFNDARFDYKPVERLGHVSVQTDWIDKHIRRTLAVKNINKKAIKKRRFKVVVDAINGAGSKALPELLECLGVKVVRLNCEGDGRFVHQPEPVAENLAQLGAAVRKNKADLGMACDPDADRLALVDEFGQPIGEEFTLTIAVRQILKTLRGATVINLSTSKATADVAAAAGSKVYYSKVGEANVIALMKRRRGVIGGEGNGGVIYPAFHAGRDALIAAALVLTCLAEEKISLNQLVKKFPKYYIIKTKAPLPDNFRGKLNQFEKEALNLLGKTSIDRQDGIRFDFEHGWLQLRSSNTEPIYRLIVETDNKQMTENLLNRVKQFFK